MKNLTMILVAILAIATLAGCSPNWHTPDWFTKTFPGNPRGHD